MEFVLKFRLSGHLYLKDPEDTPLGKEIVRNAITLIHEIGFEQFTFKKLSHLIETTEASIYRYFASKHKLLMYVMNWYWSYLEFLIDMHLPKERTAAKRLSLIISIVTHSHEAHLKALDYNLLHLHGIVIAESSKSYLVKEIDEINKEMAFGPLKSLCKRISEVILELNPKYKFARSLASTLLETAHEQQFFSEHLPSLTNNIDRDDHQDYVSQYLDQLIFAALRQS